MQEKEIRKIIDAKILKEEWKRFPKTGAKGYYYRCDGEVKNTGFSVIKELVIIGAIYKKNKDKLLTFVDKKLGVHKSAGYFAIFDLKPNKSAKFSVMLNLPSPADLIKGRLMIKNIDEKIKKKKLDQKIFLHYDTKHLDEKTKKWFKHEDIKNIKLLNQKWEIKKLKNENTSVFRCKGFIKNTGSNDVENIRVAASIKNVQADVPLSWRFKKRRPRGEFFDEIEEKEEEKDVVYEAEDEVEIPLIKRNQTIEFNATIKLPELNLIEKTEWNYKKIIDGLDDGTLDYGFNIYYEKDTDISVYRDTLEDPSVIREVKGRKKVDIIKENWTLEKDDENQRYNCRGVIKNTGNVNLENVYIISAILYPKKNEPVIWQSDSESLKSMEIEKIVFLKIGEEKEFQIYVPLPKLKTSAKSDIDAEKIIKQVESGSLIKKTNLYYKKKEVNEEGIKRLNLGNAYFRLGNYNGCIKEYSEGVKLIPDEKMFYFNLGLTYYKMLRLDASHDMLNSVLKINTNYSKALYLDALVNMKLKEWDRAINRFKMILSSGEAEKEKICYNISCAYLEKGDKKEGFRWLIRAMKINRPAVVNKALHDKEYTKYRRDRDFIDIIKEEK